MIRAARNSNVRHGAVNQRHSRPMICQQPSCWQIFYLLNRRSRLPSSQNHSQTYVVLMAASALSRPPEIALVTRMGKILWTRLFVSINSRAVILIQSALTVVVTVTAL